MPKLLTQEICQHIFEFHDQKQFHLLNPNLIQIDPDNTDGYITGTLAGLEITITTRQPEQNNLGIASALAIAKIWGKSRMHIDRVDDSHTADGNNYIISHFPPDLKADFFAQSRNLSITTSPQLKLSSFDSD